MNPALALTPYRLELGRLWARWNGKRGTDKQAAEWAARTSTETLERMLTDRGLRLPDQRHRNCPECGRQCFALTGDNFKVPCLPKGPR